MAARPRSAELDPFPGLQRLHRHRRHQPDHRRAGERTRSSVTIIPHTYRNTTLAGYRPGARVNLECDILAKHVEKLLRKLDVKSGLTVDKLREQGY